MQKSRNRYQKETGANYQKETGNSLHSKKALTKKKRGRTRDGDYKLFQKQSKTILDRIKTI